MVVTTEFGDAGICLYSLSALVKHFIEAVFLCWHFSVSLSEGVQHIYLVNFWSNKSLLVCEWLWQPRFAMLGFACTHYSPPPLLLCLFMASPPSPSPIFVNYDINHYSSLQVLHGGILPYAVWDWEMAFLFHCYLKLRNGLVKINFEATSCTYGFGQWGTHKAYGMDFSLKVSCN